MNTLQQSQYLAAKRMDYIKRQRDMRIEEVRYQLSNKPAWTKDEILELARELFEAGVEATVDGFVEQRSAEHLQWLEKLDEAPGKIPTINEAA